MTQDTTQMEEQQNILNTISKEVGLKNAQRKNEIHDEPRDHKRSPNRKQRNRKSTKLQVAHVGQTTFLKDTSKGEVARRIRVGWSCFGRKKEKFSWTTKCRSR
ncbi:hypothetical protein ElyMa_006913200 [Elysia marginata]|uniref:Uncharacterized protein n=1 Tax=Elysia marginata TaxID=1093978 RepID=A0AAV4JHV4_9GAST|nr:hypothetical protein ElyMa_006913200 [Elysia marginata]